jgi:hypothetical protein
MKTFTIDDIRTLGPCYDPARYLPKDWSGTALDILAVEDCPAEDRLWVVLHDEWIPSRTMRLFAVQCARQALALVGNPDQRSVAACDVAERYADGLATDEELAAAWAAASDAAWVAASDAAWVAASAAAWDAAWVAASAAAWDAAWDAAWAAANAAASAAAWDTAWAAARAAARDTARDTAWAAQVKQLRAMLTETQ